MANCEVYHFGTSLLEVFDVNLMVKTSVDLL